MTPRRSMPRSTLAIRPLVALWLVALLGAGLVGAATASDPSPAPSALPAASPSSPPCPTGEVTAATQLPVPSDAATDQIADSLATPAPSLEGSCGSADGPVSPSPSSSASAVGATLTVEAREFSFSPSELTIPALGTTTIVLKDAGFITHNFTVDELGLQIVAPAGRTAVGELTDPAPGTYQFFCSISGHREAGMVGTLIVE